MRQGIGIPFNASGFGYHEGHAKLPDVILVQSAELLTPRSLILYVEGFGISLHSGRLQVLPDPRVSIPLDRRTETPQPNQTPNRVALFA